MQKYANAPRMKAALTLVLCFGIGVAAPFAQPADICLSVETVSDACCCPELHAPVAPTPKPETCCDKDKEHASEPAAPVTSDAYVGCTTSADSTTDVDAYIERPRDDRAPVFITVQTVPDTQPVALTGISGSATLSLASSKIPTYLRYATLRR